MRRSAPTREGALAATLIEVLVVCGMFFAVSAAILAIYFSMARLEKQIGLHTDLDRVIITSVRHLDSLLRTSRLLKPVRSDAWTAPTEVSSLTLEPLKLGSEGVPSVTAEGFPEWDAPIEISFENGELVRQGAGRRILAKFGPQDQVTFLRSSKNLLEMRIVAGKLGERGHEVSRNTTFRFRLFNQ